jgi:Tfp pilus assembly protein PilX
MKYISTYKKDKGFAMLFAVLTASVLLSIGLSIFNLTIKELTLSSSGRESQFAFYAADSGAECALYWDLNATEIFATSSAARNPSNASPDCVDTAGVEQVFSITPSSSDGSNATTTFSLTIPNSDPTETEPQCVTVTVSKNLLTSGNIQTTINSRGYNVGTVSGTACVSSDPNRVERAIRVTY